jgi:hypothetical protein
VKKAVIIVAALAFTVQGCVSKAEFRENVKAWRGFHDAVSPDLTKLYGAMAEPSRTTRLRTISDDEDALEKAEKRAGLRDDAAPVTSPTTGS